MLAVVYSSGRRAGRVTAEPTLKRMAGTIGEGAATNTIAADVRP